MRQSIVHMEVWPLLALHRYTYSTQQQTLSIASYVLPNTLTALQLLIVLKYILHLRL